MTELERALFDLGRDLDVPEAPNVVVAVLARTEPHAASRARRRVGLAIAVALLAALAATLAVPEARSALLRVLHLGGERIELVDELPAVPTEGSGLGLDVLLGERVSLEDARRRATFDLRELEDRPDRVYIGLRETVWFLYGDPDHARLLVAQTPLLSVDENFLHKKLVGPGTRVEDVSVEGAPGYFISGDPHVLILLDELGAPVEESLRLARNVLVWEEDGVAYRLEGDFTRVQALDLAEALD